MHNTKWEKLIYLFVIKMAQQGVLMQVNITQIFSHIPEKVLVNIVDLSLVHLKFISFRFCG